MHSTTMNFLNELNTENFPELKKKLKKEYNLQVKEFENLYNINIKKNKINNNPQLNFCNGIIHTYKTSTNYDCFKQRIIINFELSIAGAVFLFSGSRIILYFLKPFNLKCFLISLIYFLLVLIIG